MFACAEGICRECKGRTNYMAYKYCDSCSLKLSKCHQCGEDITDGNTALANLESYVQNEIISFETNIIRYSNDNLLKEYYGQEIMAYRKRLQKCKEFFKDKTVEDMKCFSAGDFFSIISENAATATQPNFANDNTNKRERWCIFL